MKALQLTLLFFGVISNFFVSADTTYSGNVSTVINSDKIPGAGPKELYLKRIAAWAEFNDENGSQFSAEFERKHYSKLPLAFMKYGWCPYGSDNDWNYSYTDESGNFSFATNGDNNYSVSFYMEDTSGRRLVDERGSDIKFQFQTTPHITSYEYTVSYEENQKFAGGNLMFWQLDKLRRIFLRAEPYIKPEALSAFYAGLQPNGVYGASQDVTGFFYGYAYNVQNSDTAPLAPIVPSPYGAVYHEPFHFMLSRIYGVQDYSSVAIEQTNCERHKIGSDLGPGFWRTAFDESVCHFGGGVGIGLPIGGIYHITFSDYCNTKGSLDYWIEEGRVSELPTQVENAIEAMKRARDLLIQGRNSIEAVAEEDLNTIEGYATEFFNEIYFKESNQSPEALAKILNVLHADNEFRIGGFLDTWKSMYPADTEMLERVVDSVRYNINERPKSIAERWKNEIEEYEEQLYGGTLPPPPLPSDVISYVPGGMAKCPGKEVYLVTDNTNGSILMITKNGSFREYHVLLSNLTRPGDIDIGDLGRSFVVVDGDEVKKYWFGLSGHVYNRSGHPVSGATVMVQTETGDYISNTDSDGYFNILNLQKPVCRDTFAVVTITFGGETQQYTVPLDYECQTCEEFEFAQEVAPPVEEGEEEVEGELVVEGEVLTEGELAEGEVEGEAVLEGEQAIEGEVTGEGEIIEGEVVLEGEELVYYELFISTTGNGATSPSEAGSPWSYLESSLVSLSATPDDGWRFDHWEGDIGGTDNPVDVLMNGPKNVVAVFVEDNKNASSPKQRMVLTMSQALSGE